MLPVGYIFLDAPTHDGDGVVPRQLRFDVRVPRLAVGPSRSLDVAVHIICRRPIVSPHCFVATGLEVGEHRHGAYNRSVQPKFILDI